MFRNRNQKLVRMVALITALAMVLATGLYLFTMTGWFGTGGFSGEWISYGAVSSNLTDRERFEQLEEFTEEVRLLFKDDLPSDQLFQGLYRGLFEALDDRWSVYYPLRETADRIIESIQGDYSGVGITMTTAEGKVLITSLAPEGPAERAGVQEGDCIVCVDGMDVTDLTLEEVSALIRGKEGTNVSLTVDRVGVQKSFSMVREVIKTVSVTGDLLEDNIGYIRISTFDNDTDNEFAALRLTLLNRGARALIIDLRGNSGGVMASALNIADQLVPFEGTLAHYERQGELVRTIHSYANVTKRVPIAVLVNRYTASAAECLAGALQDNGVAHIIGHTTYGKGVAQVISTSPDGGAYKLSIYYFLTPNMHHINGVGIVPDLLVHEAGGLSGEEIDAVLRILAPMSEQKRYYSGQTGLNVYGAQQRLRHLGYDVPINATMDAGTVAAIRAFQADKKLYAYGVLDFTTTEMLARAFEAYLFGGTEDLALAAARNWLR